MQLLTGNLKLFKPELSTQQYTLTCMCIQHVSNTIDDIYDHPEAEQLGVRGVEPPLNLDQI